MNAVVSAVLSTTLPAQRAMLFRMSFGMEVFDRQVACGVCGAAAGMPCALAPRELRPHFQRRLARWDRLAHKNRSGKE